MRSLKTTLNSLTSKLVVCVALLGLVAGTGCEMDELEYVTGYSDPWGVGSTGSGSNSVLYGWGEYTNSNSGNSFTLSSGTNISESLDNYFSSQW